MDREVVVYDGVRWHHLQQGHHEQLLCIIIMSSINFISHAAHTLDSVLMNFRKKVLMCMIPSRQVNDITWSIPEHDHHQDVRMLVTNDNFNITKH